MAVRSTIPLQCTERYPSFAPKPEPMCQCSRCRQSGLTRLDFSLQWHHEMNSLRDHGKLTAVPRVSRAGRRHQKSLKQIGRHGFRMRRGGMEAVTREWRIPRCSPDGVEETESDGACQTGWIRCIS